MKRVTFGAGGTVAALLAAVVLISGCGGSDGGTTAGLNQGQAVEPGGVLHVTGTTEVSTLDPFAVVEATDVQTDYQIVETLYRQIGSGKIVPWLATSYTRSPDGLTWTFQLRPGVKFSNGQPLTAKDVVFSLETARTGEYASGFLNPVKHVSAPTNETVRVETREPMASLIAILASHYAPIVPSEFGGVSEMEFGQHPIGTGPFMLKHWDQGRSITLVKNPHYWKPNLPVADELVFDITPDDSSRLTQFRGGQLDVLPQPEWSQLKSLEETPTTRVGKFGLFNVDALSLNMTKPIFKNSKIREAINLAIDREGIVKTALGGYGKPALGFLPPTLGVYYDKEIQPPAVDVAAAKKLVKEAQAEGIQPNFTLELIAGESYPQTASQIIEQNLSEAGFKVQLQPLDSAAMVERWLGGEADASLVAYNAGVPDPSELAAFYPEIIGKPNGAQSASRLEAMAVEAGAELKTAKRQALYDEMQEIVAKELQLVPIDYSEMIWATQSNVAGLQVNSTNNPWFAETGFTK